MLFTSRLSIEGFLCWTWSFQQSQGQTSELTRLVVGKLPHEVSSPNGGRTWKLGENNKTTSIDSAFLFGDRVVVFGWAGTTVGIATILDATKSSEILEFLEYDAHITPDGLIVFRRFYPHFSESSIISDKIAVLDLASNIPTNVPADPPSS